jgi:hypothetical protein
VRAALADILKSMSGRSAGAVQNQLRKLRAEKLLHGDAKLGFRLTQPGHAAAVQEVRRVNAA